jgi:polyferredoxin
MDGSGTAAATVTNIGSPVMRRKNPDDSFQAMRGLSLWLLVALVVGFVVGHRRCVAACPWGTMNPIKFANPAVLCLGNWRTAHER